MYIDISPEDRNSEEEDLAYYLQRIEELVLKEGETDTFEERKIWTSRDFQTTTLSTQTKYQHSLQTIDYVAQLVNKHNTTEEITNPRNKTETVFSTLRIVYNDENILEARRSKGGYRREPFLLLSRTKIVKPMGWTLSRVASLEDALIVMDSFGEDYQKMKEITNKRNGVWTGPMDYSKPLGFNKY